MLMLIEVGYDPGRQMFAPSREHPIFGFTECAVRDCPGLAAQAGDLCGPCARRWRSTQPAGMALEEFVAAPRLRIVQRRKREVLCRVCCVADFERPASGPLGLCLLCAKSFRRSRVPSVDDWIRGGQQRESRRAPRAPARQERFAAPPAAGEPLRWNDPVAQYWHRQLSTIVTAAGCVPADRTEFGQESDSDLRQLTNEALAGARAAYTSPSQPRAGSAHHAAHHGHARREAVCDREQIGR